MKYKNVNQDDYFQSSNLYINGEVAGRVTNEQVGTILLLDKKNTLFKTDSVFIKKNPLGTVYFDVVKTNYVKNTTLEYRSGDTIIIYNKVNKFTIDGNKAKKIIEKLDNTLKQIDTILKE
ncbi:hypothetical protein ACFOWM_12265 [Ferruginibacter yonginensis]|uniref:Uncharacterized protein n=1 Tax=Ferruginibacter yonginensis TaxID=1310416 RepID=A0ABV8QTS5_9BACT